MERFYIGSERDAVHLKHLFHLNASQAVEALDGDLVTGVADFVAVTKADGIGQRLLLLADLLKEIRPEARAIMENAGVQEPGMDSIALVGGKFFGKDVAVLEVFIEGALLFGSSCA